jgi:hypothetical protein
MKYLLNLLLAIPLQARASLLLQYALNYTSQTDDSTTKSESSQTFHKILLVASVNARNTLFLGWDINSWSSTLKQGASNEESYSLLEMGPWLQWFMNENQNVYVTAEWNPYARGDREKAGSSRGISGSSMGFGIGYKFRISRYTGFGASLNYHTLSVSEEMIGSTETNVSDTVTNLMPMLEFVIITR